MGATMKPPQEKSRVALHQGQALMRIAGTYPTMQEVILEGVQNALDEAASRIWIIYSQHGRHLTMRDNGNGVTKEKFEAALMQVCASLKEAGKLGRFGIGLISPLGKCDRFTFTSCHRNSPAGFLEWTFVTDGIRNQAVIDGIPMRRQQDIRFGHRVGRGGGPRLVEWRTQVRLERITQDRFISRVSLDGLTESILDRYSATMLRNNTVVSIKIIDADGVGEERQVKGSEYRGQRLEEVTLRDSDAGVTTFRLYLAPKTVRGRQGKVVVGEQGDEFRISFGVFARTVDDEWLDDDVKTALLSGVFEGEILTEKSTLHPGRKGFVENAALVGFCGAIGEWFKKVGREHYEVVQEARQDQRYQELGLRSMGVMESLLKAPEGSWLNEVVDSFQRGTVGRGHAEVSEGIVTGEVIRATSTEGRPGTDGGDGDSREKGDTETANPEHRPHAVSGPRGRTRSFVKSDSLGLIFAHEAMEGSDELWKLDTRRGILSFNIRHPLWVKCERSDRALMRLQEFLAVEALVVNTMPEEYRDLQRKALDQFAEPYTFVILHGDTIAGRIPSRTAAAEKRKK